MTLRAYAKRIPFLASAYRRIRNPCSIQFERFAPGWIARNLKRGVAQVKRSGDPSIENLAAETERLGTRPLWGGYKEISNYRASTTVGRSSNQVRTNQMTGALFAWLAETRRPEEIVEFGTAFGVSGMYWLSGLERAGVGHLMTYEPNDDWSGEAENNLRQISDRFTLTRGTFEDNAARTLRAGTVDIAFIDAIHTEEFVMAQWAILKPYMMPGSLVLFDDINFSESMQKCWQTVAFLPEVKCSATIGRRLGIIELVDW